MHSISDTELDALLAALPDELAGQLGPYDVRPGYRCWKVGRRNWLQWSDVGPSSRKSIPNSRGAVRIWEAFARFGRDPGAPWDKPEKYALDWKWMPAGDDVWGCSREGLLAYPQGHRGAQGATGLRSRGRSPLRARAVQSLIGGGFTEWVIVRSGTSPSHAPDAPWAGSERGVIELDRASIDRVLPLVARGLEQYWQLQSALPITNVARDRDFQRAFNAFYRVRRDPRWQSSFYRLLEQSKGKRPPFAVVLRTLHRETGRVEASFASKLVATLDPELPLIDRFVLQNLGQRLPTAGRIERRLDRTIDIHEFIRRTYAAALDGPMGHRLVAAFEQAYPSYPVTRVKMLDLVLWQRRDP